MKNGNLAKNIKKLHPIYVIAHRGANAECPENSMLAFEKAVEIGADLIEFDIHKTLDNEIVVIHDKFTSRVSNEKLNVEKSNFKDLSTVMLDENQSIPRIDDLFRNFKGKIGFQVEIKQKDLSKLLWEKIQQFNVEDSVLISSFQHSELVDFRKLNKTIPLVTLEPFISGYVKSLFSKDTFIDNALKKGVDGIHPKFTYVDEEFVRKSHELGLVVNPWTVDKPEDWKYLLECGVDGIITNDPRNLIKYLDKN